MNTKKQLSEKFADKKPIEMFEYFIAYLDWSVAKKFDINFKNFHFFASTINIQSDLFVIRDRINFDAGLKIAKLLKNDDYIRIILTSEKERFHLQNSIF